ncbi:MAG: bifunctional hydroxymethylpyrimidine kinase/phosphomethylpyrimidine kinase, partial [Alicyclobacillus sp.]|nr:bifunctional hydroxymethylpyrimidine kinase/phosphomethylpyrimidine kinase [Alicyclobacillus sp.]
MYRTAQGRVVRALTVAGSDSGGGAGIQADLKTFAAFDVYGTSAITALTAQNTVGVQGVWHAGPAFVQQQMKSVLDDIGTDAVKTGMLGQAETAEAVAEVLREYRNRQQEKRDLAVGVRRLVLDPVMVAKGGEALLQPDAVEAVRKLLLPLAAVVTPNLPEAEVLCGHPIRSWADAFRAARDLHRLGAQVVVLKGGHAQAEWSQREDQP